MAKGGDYVVGHGKPPKEHQFQPGQSGNPRGREKGKRGLRTDLIAALDAVNTITINGKQVTGKNQYLMFRTLAERAARGDLKAQAQLLPYALQVLGIEDRGGKKQGLSPSDQALFDDLLADMDGEAIDGSPDAGDVS